MDYQLVLQFRGGSLEDYDEMIALENQLIEELGDSAHIDGHDMGSGERNIFILTSAPVRTFSEAIPVLERTQNLQAVRAAYRQIKGDRYTIIWPEGSKEKFTIT